MSLILRDAGVVDGSTIHLRGASCETRADRIDRAVAVLGFIQEAETGNDVSLRSSVLVRYLGETHGLSVGVRAMDHVALNQKVRSVVSGPDIDSGLVVRVLQSHTRGEQLAGCFTKSELCSFMVAVGEFKGRKGHGNLSDVSAHAQTLLDEQRKRKTELNSGVEGNKRKR